MLGLPELDGDVEGRDREHAAALHPGGGGGARRLTPRPDFPEPLLLALDAAGSACSVAVAAGDRVLAVRHAAMLHGQAEALLPTTAAAMDDAGLAPSALDFVAAVVGPGSFTGIRAGLAAARGIVLALGKPLLGVDGFAAVAASADRDGGLRFLLVAIESRRRELYVQLFDAERRPLSDPAAIMPEALDDRVAAAIGTAPVVLAGDAAARAAAALAGRRRVIVPEDAAPTAVGAARSALRRWRLGDRGGEVQALYLRPPDVTLSGGNRGAARS